MASTSALAMRAGSVFRQRQGPPGMASGFQEAWKVYTETGAIQPHPSTTRFAIMKVMGVVLPGLYAGAYISKRAAEFMDAHEIFVPSDDDD